MSRVSEDEVSKRRFESLQKMGGANFGKFAVAVQHLNEKVQLKLIEQLPEFRNLAKDALDSIDAGFQATLDTNDASEKALYEGHIQWRNALVKMLDDPSLSLDDKLRITAEIGRSIDLQAAKDSESKRFKAALLSKKIGGAVALVGVVVVAITGGKFMMDNNQSGDS